MAVIEEEKIEMLDIDITDTALAEGDAQEQDLKEDWQARACPPPSGTYKLKLSMEKKDFQQGHKRGFQKDDANGKYYKAQITCKIQDATGKWQDSVVFYNVSTGIPKGKNLSTMAGMLIMMGDKALPKKITELALAKRFFAVVTKNLPILVAETDWSTWDRSDKSAGDFGSAFLVGMKNFPKKADGTGFQHIVKTKKGEELVAKLKIVKWVGKPGATATSAPSAPVAPPAPALQIVKQQEIQVVESNAGELQFGDDGEVNLDLT